MKHRFINKNSLLMGKCKHHCMQMHKQINVHISLIPSLFLLLFLSFWLGLAFRVKEGQFIQVCEGLAGHQAIVRLQQGASFTLLSQVCPHCLQLAASHPCRAEQIPVTAGVVADMFLPCKPGTVCWCHAGLVSTVTNKDICRHRCAHRRGCHVHLSDNILG